MERQNKAFTRIGTKELATRAEQDDDKIVEGYFAVFNSTTELGLGLYEEIAPEAFNNTLGNEVKALYNHDTGFVLGNNKIGTLELKIDSHGLWGRIKINPNDSQAKDIYERVKRGDVNTCSFGFHILSEETEFRDDGTVKWIIKEIDLHEVSICPFAQYIDTNIQARMKEVEQHKGRQLETKKNELRGRLQKIC